MAKGDIMPYRGQAGEGSNPVIDTLRAPLLAGESFVQGEPVTIGAAGSLRECVTSVTTGDFAGIALESGDTVGATDPIGTYRTPLGAFTPGASPNAPVAGDMIGFWKASLGQKFITRRLSSDGTGATLVAPVASNRGDPVRLVLNNGNWGADVNVSAGTMVGVITDVLDAAGEDISRSGLPGVSVVFEITASRWTSGLAPVAA